MQSPAELKFDLDTAREMVDSFSYSNGITCRLLDNSGKTLYKQGMTMDERDAFQMILRDFKSYDELHLKGILQAERFGGRYIYDCPNGLTFFCSPILVGSSMIAALVAGPVLIEDMDDVLDSIIEKWNLPGIQVRPLRTFFASVPQIEPSRLNHLSNQLFANAVYLGDGSRALFLAEDKNRQQREIGEYVHRLKADSQEVPYPIEKEREMLSAVTRGDKPTASALLNEILGHIFFFSKEADTVQTRIMELLAVLSRAVIDGGGNMDLVFHINCRYLQELRQLHSQEEVTNWLAQVLNRYVDMVFDLVDSKHQNMICNALSYINMNYARNLTMNEVADYVGYSHSHFSRVFKEEMGTSFRVYLNSLRVEKSKYHLLSGMATISEICGLCGFEDQSYYCKVFKKIVGVTPDKFRKQMRRIDKEREYGF